MNLRRGVALAAVVLMGLGLWIVLRADDGLVRERMAVADLPVTVLSPAAEGPFPAVVVSHGFSGSARLMDGIGIAFARDGWLVALPDHSGHGANHASLGDADLAEEVGSVVSALRQRGDVATVALLGHSMGAGAVTQAAAADPALPVVALSLPSADDLPDTLTALFVVGAAEPDRFGEAAAEAAALGYPTVEIPAAQHISILFRTPTLRESVTWLDSVVGRQSGQVSPDWRLGGVALVYLGSALLFWPLSAWVLSAWLPVASAGVRGKGGRVPGWVVLPLAGVLAGALLAVLPWLGEVVPLMVGGYLAAFFAVTGLVAWAASRRWERPAARTALAGLGLGLLVALAIGVPAHLAWAEVSLTGVRGLSALAIAVAALVLAWAELALPGRYGSMLAGRLLLSAVLAGLALAGFAPGFIALLVPLVAVMLPWFGAYGVRLRELSGSPLAGALVQAPVIALLIAVTAPVA